MIFFFSSSKNDFLLSRIFPNKYTVNLFRHKLIRHFFKPVTAVYPDADIAILVFAKLLQDSNKIVKLII